MKIIKQQTNNETKLAYELVQSEYWNNLLLPHLLVAIQQSSTTSNKSTEQILCDSYSANYARKIIEYINSNASVEAKALEKPIDKYLTTVKDALRGLLLLK